MKTFKIPAILGILSGIMAVLSITTSSTMFQNLFVILGISGLLLQAIYVEKNQAKKILLIILSLLLLLRRLV